MRFLGNGGMQKKGMEFGHLATLILIAIIAGLFIAYMVIKMNGLMQ